MTDLKLIVATFLVFKVITSAKSQFMPPLPMSPMSMPMMSPMGLPMPMGMPPMMQQKLPVVVMPYKRNKNQKKHKRKRKHKKSSSESESSASDSSCSSESGEIRTGRRLAHSGKHGKKRRQVLTPVISYVTKDGYVVYQKKIKKDTAKDWLEIGKKSQNRIPVGSREHGVTSDEVLHMMLLKKKLKKYEEEKMARRNSMSQK